VAKILDVVTVPEGDPEWERRRTAVTDAMRRARTTYGMYNASSDDDRPGRLIEALVKIVHETVALRALVGAEASSPLHSGAEPEIRDAITVLAARLRLLAGAIGDQVGGSFDTADSAASHRLGDRIGEIRRAAFEGHEDLVASALAAQIWWTVLRIAASIDSAGRITAAGITVGGFTPRLPETPRPTSLWNRSVTAVTRRSAHLRVALRAGVAVLVATVIWAAFEIPHGHWLVIAVFLCLRNTYGETVSRVLERTGGTALGGILAAILLAVARGQTELAVIIFVCAFIGFTLSPVSYIFWMCFCTPLIMTLVDFGFPVSWDQAVVRIVLTVGGGLLALAAARLLWPSSGTVQLPAVLAPLCTTLSDLVRTAAISGNGLAQPLARSREAADAVTTLGGRMAQEPTPDLGLVGRLRDAAAIANRIRDQVITVTALSRAEQGEMGPVSSLLIQIGDHLERVAAALERGEVRVPGLDLDELLGDLDGHLSSLVRRRRAEVAGGTALEETTPLHQELLSVAAVRHALRGMYADVRELDVVLTR
jgi:uncharacterized membrane protein YccC